MSDALLPCPFCRGKAEIVRQGTPRVSHVIECTNCGARLETGETFGPYAWNTRAPAWISVADRLPENNNEVLVCDWESILMIGYYNHFAKSWNRCRVTHWMPLPAMPSAGEGT